MKISRLSKGGEKKHLPSLQGKCRSGGGSGLKYDEAVGVILKLTMAIVLRIAVLAHGR